MFDTVGYRELTLMSLGAASVATILSIDPKAVFGDPQVKKSWKVVEFDELVKMLRQHCIQLFDVRERDEVKETGTIPRAVNVPLSEFEAAFQMSPTEFRHTYGAFLPSKKDLNIVTSCLSGKRSCKALTILHNNGWKYARTYAGSWMEYSSKEPVHI